MINNFHFTLKSEIVIVSVWVKNSECNPVKSKRLDSLLKHDIDWRINSVCAETLHLLLSECTVSDTTGTLTHIRNQTRVKENMSVSYFTATRHNGQNLQLYSYIYKYIFFYVVIKSDIKKSPR